MPKIVLLFLPDFTRGQKRLFIFCGIFGAYPAPGCRRISPAPGHARRRSTAAEACPTCPTQVYRNGHNAQCYNNIIVYLIWALFAQKILTYTLLGSIISAYRTRAHPVASQSTPGTPPHQPTGQHGEYTTSGSRWQEIRP